jgi:hypothetical protein
LEAAAIVLELHLQPMPPDLHPWAWKNWVQWHALAIILAELLVRPQGLLSDRAYQIAMISFRHYAKIVADSESGMLWKPIAKLMRRVQKLRQGALVITASTTSNNDNEGLHQEEHEPFFMTRPKSINDLQMLDSIDWNFDDPNWSAFLNDDLAAQTQNINEANAEATPWLAWDSFLQDVSLPDI